MKKEKEESEAKYKHALVDQRKEQVRAASRHMPVCCPYTLLHWVFTI